MYRLILSLGVVIFSGTAVVSYGQSPSPSPSPSGSPASRSDCWCEDVTMTTTIQNGKPVLQVTHEGGYYTLSDPGESCADMTGCDASGWGYNGTMKDECTFCGDT